MPLWEGRFWRWGPVAVFEVQQDPQATRQQKLLSEG